jgi:hypothetical protein
MVLLDQVVQVLRRPHLRLGGQQAIGFQLTHRAVRRGIAVQSDRPGSIVLAFDRLPKKRLGGRDIALGAQPEAQNQTNALLSRLAGSGGGLGGSGGNRGSRGGAASGGTVDAAVEAIGGGAVADFIKSWGLRSGALIFMSLRRPEGG